MKQKIINGILIAAIVFIAASVLGIFVLDGVAQSIIQSKGSEGLGVELKLDSAHVGLFSNKSSLSGVKIANPKPFVSKTTPTILTIDETKITFNIFQMFDKEAIIQTTTVTGVTFHLQQEEGKSNIEIIVNHISEDDSPKAAHPEPPFIIETLTIRDITVVASGKFTVLDSGPVTAHIEEIVLHKIGSDGDVEVATEAITTAITNAIMQELAAHPVEGFSRVAFSHVTGLINELPVFKQLGIGTVIQGVTDTAGKVVDGVLGGIGDLLDGDKDKN